MYIIDVISFKVILRVVALYYTFVCLIVHVLNYNTIMTDVIKLLYDSQCINLSQDSEFTKFLLDLTKLILDYDGV